MIDRHLLIGGLCACCLSLAIVPLATGSNAFAASSATAAIDKNNDGTLDLVEVKNGAGSVFDKLEKDSDATLEAKEVGARISKKDLKAADLDNDGTLTVDEYLALVEKLFNPADTDKDGTIDAKELHSKAGHALLRLIQ
jgi:Ca2+-binding EF-hand superfamily protein